MRLALIAAMGAVALIGAAPAARAQPAPTAPTAPQGPVYEIETLTTGPMAPSVVKEIEPLHTLQAVEALLKENRVTFGWALRQVSAASMPPALVVKLDSLPPREVFAIKQPDGGVLVGVILSKH